MNLPSDLSASTAANPRFATIEQEGEPVSIEYRWTGSDSAAAPSVVFLHEGLGSLSAWRDFPDRLCTALGARGLVYSRAGYGRSTPRPHGRRWRPDFMHRQAREVLPRFLAAVGIDTSSAAPWLFGHSDGASIALIHAASFPHSVTGVIAVAPHVFVEELSVRSIASTREVYLSTDLRERLARHHADVDSAFWGWNDIWLDPAFLAWNIEDLLGAIRCPVLAVQGHDDEYGTMAQVDRLAARVPQAEVLKLDACGHSPHRDQPAALIAASVDFFRRHRQIGATR